MHNFCIYVYIVVSATCLCGPGSASYFLKQGVLVPLSVAQVTETQCTGTRSLNIPSSPNPFPLGLHALPLGLLDRACTQAGPMSSLERRVAQHTFTHASLINESSAALTNFPTPADSCIGPACEAGLSIDV